MSSTTRLGRIVVVKPVDHTSPTGPQGPRGFSLFASSSVSNRPIWLVDAPPRSTRLAADDPAHRGITARAGRRR